MTLYPQIGIAIWFMSVIPLYVFMHKTYNNMDVELDNISFFGDYFVVSIGLFVALTLLWPIVVPGIAYWLYVNGKSN